MDAEPKFGTWYPVSQEPPMYERYGDGPLSSGQLIVFTGYYVGVGSREESYKQRKRSWKNAYGANATVTHWMPMPPKPEAI